MSLTSSHFVRNDRAAEGTNLGVMAIFICIQIYWPWRALLQLREICSLINLRILGMFFYPTSANPAVTLWAFDLGTVKYRAEIERWSLARDPGFDCTIYADREIYSESSAVPPPTHTQWLPTIHWHNSWIIFTPFTLWLINKIRDALWDALPCSQNKETGLSMEKPSWHASTGSW